MNKSHSDVKFVMSMDIYSGISQKINDQEGRKIKTIKMQMDSPKPKIRNNKQGRHWDQTSTKECKPKIDMRSSKKIRKSAKKHNKQSIIRLPIKNTNTGNRVKINRRRR